MFRFSIRELLWLIVVVALAACWWTDRRDARRQKLEYQARIAAQEVALRAKDTHIAAVRARLESTRADATAIRELLAEFIATQEDKLKIDVGAGYYRRLTNSR